MYNIRAIRKENKRESNGRSDYSAVVDLRVLHEAKTAKKIELPSLQPLQIRERRVLRAPILQTWQQENPQNNSAKNSFGIIPRTFARLLVGFFLLNPFLDVYADELPIIPLPVEITGTTTPLVIPPSPETATTTSPENITLLADGTSLSTTTENSIPPALEATSTDTEISTSTPEAPAPILAEVIASSTPSAETTTTTAPLASDETVVADTGEASTTLDTVAVAEASNTPEVVENNPVPDVPVVVSEPVKTDEPVPEPQKTEPITEAPKEETASSTPAINVIEHKYLFRENECTHLDDGGFYCAPPDVASTTSVSNVSLPRVFAESDAKNGAESQTDKEIFFEDVNGKVKITNNDTDDDAPSYDKQSGLIAWHSLIRGRFQIMLYDKNASASTARQITDTSSNNTNPEVHGKSVVWQGWVNNNWEIFYTKDATAETPVIQQITANDQPDMFPRLSDGFITWQSFSAGSWHVFVYSLENGEISQISKPEAGKYENPRFALLFENRKENGDVETVGYDVASGEEIPINAPHTPVSAPATSSQGEKDKAVPVPASGGTASTSAPVKNPGKDDENHEA